MDDKEGPSGKVRSGMARMAKLTADQRRALARKAAAARWNTSKTATTYSNENNNLTTISSVKTATPVQQVFDLGIEKQIEIDGIGMGVLSDGTPFLTGRGLARLCGVRHSVIQGLSTEWSEEPVKARITSIKNLLLGRGIDPDQLYIPIRQRSGTFFAYPDASCLAILEYYSFDAGPNVKRIALRNYRLLAGAALREFIYTQVGYDPSGSVPDAWRQFHDRVSLTYNSVPHGHFGIFKEMADMIVNLGQSGLQIDSKFVPDISVGFSWAKHWTTNNLADTYGKRRKFEHNYPDYFPQSQSNPQEPWCYPDGALGEFRRWLREVYIGAGKFAKYITGQVKKRELPASFAQLAIAAYEGDDQE